MTPYPADKEYIEKLEKALKLEESLGSCLADDETGVYVGGLEKALDRLRDGRQLRRQGWNGKGMWIALQEPDEGSKMTLPYIYMRTADGNLVPWIASQTDLLAKDWIEVWRMPE